jgi:signal peptidase I
MSTPSFAAKVYDFTKTVVIASFLAFFCIRGFVFEPFKIPSGSMLPTLQVGDFLFVSKFAYGNRLPLTDYFFWQTEPQRGDIVVFKKSGSGLPGSFFGLAVYQASGGPAGGCDCL